MVGSIIAATTVESRLATMFPPVAANVKTGVTRVTASGFESIVGSPPTVGVVADQPAGSVEKAIV